MKLFPLFWLAASLALAGAAHASEFEDFRIPDHWTRRWLLSASGLALSGTESGGGAESNPMQGQGALRGYAQWSRDGESRAWGLALDAQLTGDRTLSEWESVTEMSSPFGGPWLRLEEDDRFERRLSEALSGSVSVTEYPGRAPWAWWLSLGGIARWGQSWSNRVSTLVYVDPFAVTRYEDFDDAEAWTYDYSVSAGAGFGRGRVRDATGVYQARLLERRLEQDGLLARPMSESGRRTLAALFYARPGFSAPHELPDKYFLREVERVLRDDGALDERGLDAYAALHVLEPVLVARDFRRRSGWFVGPSLVARHEHAIVRGSAWGLSRRIEGDTLTFEFPRRSSFSMDAKSDVVLAGPGAEYHRPIGLRLQLDAGASALFDVEGYRRETQISSAVTLGYLVDERWWLSGGVSQNRRIVDRDLDDSRWSTAASAAVAYRLVDRWWMRLGADQRQSRSTGVFTGGPSRFVRQHRVSLDVSFQRGALDAPGLVDPVRPMH